jgi:predicted glycoside hydrolase/deacetylase ChbG (UPF0249 family)
VTDPAPGPSAGPATWIRGIAAALTAAGLTADLHHTPVGLDLTATRHPPGQKETEVLVDEDGYIELRWWAVPGATAEQVAAAVTRALAAITAAGDRTQP